MRNLIRFILSYHFFILFLILETLSLTLAFQHNNYQKAKFVNLSQGVTGFFYSKTAILNDYLSLRKTNQQLAAENTKLNNILQRAYRSDEIFFYGEYDTAYQQHYFYTSARIINNSVNKQNNYLTLNKGIEAGIKLEMAVVSPEGIVGVVNGVSKRFSTVISLLNTDLRISAKIQKNNYFGSLSWDGKDYREAILYEIPHHVLISKGDTIITSGFSTIYPEGVLIGIIKDFEVIGGNFYEIIVQLSTDFKNLTYVNVVSNLRKEEQIELEEQLEYD
ncbi:MAG: rod shape-determining protein MreC [Bacteroidales bacterium]|nr:MAG: rod shape-determining protein MreC [Bacteroidales bacterium]